MSGSAALIRTERPGDEPAISALITRAFASAARVNGSEAEIVEQLRSAGALSLSLVATEAEAVVGCAVFSPVTIGEARGWHGLGPVAVAPDRQRRGIGAHLIGTGLRRLRDAGAAGVVVLGDPDYYARFGFVAVDGLRFADLPPGPFRAISFDGPAPAGDVRYHPAFG